MTIVDKRGLLLKLFFSLALTEYLKTFLLTI